MKEDIQTVVLKETEIEFTEKSCKQSIFGKFILLGFPCKNGNAKFENLVVL